MVIQGNENPWGYSKTKNADGTYTDANGTISDKWGNTWNAATGEWYNSNGQQWAGTNPANGTGIFTEPTSYLDKTGKPAGGGNSLLDQILANLGGGGGGSGSADNGAALAESARQFDTTFTQDREQQEWKNNFDNANFNWQKAQDDRDYALALGDMELAKQKQADANYWQGKSYELDQQRLAADQAMNAADNSTRLQTAQIGAQAQISSANISAAAARYQADLQLQQGLANAHNDQERNKVMLAHEQEIANIAKMEDDTKRRIAAGEQKIGGFNAETARMTGMGDVALKNNQFILDASKSPRDLFGLYFMQRGITPDWDGLAQGNVTQGDPLKVYDPMKVYTPNITMPTNFDMAANGTQAAVGSATQNLGIASNPYLNMGMSNTQQQQQQQTPRFADGTKQGQQFNIGVPQFDTIPNQQQPAGQFGDMARSQNQGFGYQPPQANTDPILRPANGERTGSPFTAPQPVMTFNQMDFGQTGRIDQGPVTSPVRQAPPAVIQNTREGQVPQGFTTEPRFMTGDSPSQNPWDGGARPEIIENPTNAPIRVKNTNQTAMDFGIQPNNPMEPQMFEGFDPIRQGVQPYNPHMFFPGGQGKKPTPKGMLSGGNEINMGNDHILNGGGSAGGAAGGNQNIQQMIMDFLMSMNQGAKSRTPRYALGTNSFYQQNSQNEYLNGRPNIPSWIQTLADYGAPIAPSLFDSVSGGTSPTLNMGSSFNQRGGGMLPSLQTLNRQSAGENELFSGYVDGPVGMPSQDVIDFIGRPTQNLRTAQRSSATIM